MNLQEHNEANREFEKVKEQYPLAWKKICLMRYVLHSISLDLDSFKD